MINLIGFTEIYKNLAVLGSKNNRKLPKSRNDLEDNFHSFLNEYQPDVPRLKNRGVNIIKDRILEEKLVEKYQIDTLLDDKQQSTVMGDKISDQEICIKEKILLDAISNLSKLDKNVHNLFQVCIDSLFFRNSSLSGGGSTSSAIGVIWVNNRSHWNLQDVTELLIHELVHNLVFIDELRYLHYKDYDLIVKPKNFAQSAILHTKRPIDKVFHSIVVAVELLLARKNFLGEPVEFHIHPPSNKLLEQAKKSIESLLSLPNYNDLMTERSQFLLNKCTKLLS